MPVYLFTMHAYRSWMPDRPQGYVRRGKGLLEPDCGRAFAYRQAATEPPVSFGPVEYPVMAWIAHDCCVNRGWQLRAITIVPSHTHVVVSWRDAIDRGEVFAKIKNLMSLELNRRAGQHREHWFSRSGSKQQVKDREHYERLLNEYLPKHNGYFWREGMPPPQRPA